MRCLLFLDSNDATFAVGTGWEDCGKLIDQSGRRMRMQLRALRGAILCRENSKEEIVERTAQLLREMIKRNDIRPEDIVDVIFTATEDLTAEFPAAAARHIGLTTCPFSVPGS